MFEVEVVHERDAARAAAWLQQEYHSANIHGIGDRYASAAVGNGQLVERLREDAGSSSGLFARLKFNLDPSYAERLRQLDVDAIKARVSLAVQRTLARELPRAQGAYCIRFEGPQGDPKVYAALSSRLSDGGDLPILSRGDIHALEARWDREIQRVVGVRRDLVVGQREGPSRAESHERAPLRALESRFEDAVGEVRRAVADRTSGLIPQEGLRMAIEKAESAQEMLRLAAREAAGPTARVSVFESVRLNLRDGATYFSRIKPDDVGNALLRAAQDASGLSPKLAQELRIVTYPRGSDLRVTVYFKDKPDGPAGSQQIDMDALREALATRFGEALRQQAPRCDTHGRGVVGEPGRVELLGPERTSPARQRALAGAPAAPSRGDEAVVGRVPGSSWEPVVGVRLKLERGVLDLGKHAPEVRQEILQKAVARTFPFLQAQKLHGCFLPETNGRSLTLLVVVPERAGWTKEQLERPLFQSRFVHETYRQLAFHEGGAARGSGHDGPIKLSLEHGQEAATAVRQAGAGTNAVLARVPGGEIGKDAGRAGVWEKLSRAIPAPMRVALGFARTVGRMIPRE